MSDRELFHRHPGNPILTAGDWPYPVNAVFNPAAVRSEGTTVLLARVEDLRGISHLTVARSANGFDNWSVAAEPLLEPLPGIESEVWGFEDARAVWVEELEPLRDHLHGVRACRAGGLSRHDAGLRFGRAARNRRDARGQECSDPARARRRRVDSLPSAGEWVRNPPPRDRALAFLRPGQLGRCGNGDGASLRRLVGLTADRDRPAAPQDRTRVATDLPRRQGNRRRRPLPRRRRTTRPRPAKSRDWPQPQLDPGPERAHTSARETCPTRCSRAA